MVRIRVGIVLMLVCNLFAINQEALATHCVTRCRPRCRVVVRARCVRPVGFRAVFVGVGFGYPMVGFPMPVMPMPLAYPYPMPFPPPCAPVGCAVGATGGFVASGYISGPRGTISGTVIGGGSGAPAPYAPAGYPAPHII